MYHEYHLTCFHFYKLTANSPFPRALPSAEENVGPTGIPRNQMLMCGQRVDFRAIPECEELKSTKLTTIELVDRVTHYRT